LYWSSISPPRSASEVSEPAKARLLRKIPTEIDVEPSLATPSMLKSGEL
jgi:hypothetical protein